MLTFDFLMVVHHACYNDHTHDHGKKGMRTHKIETEVYTEAHQQIKSPGGVRLHAVGYTLDCPVWKFTAASHIFVKLLG
jgi:hypothetical protein